MNGTISGELPVDRFMWIAIQRHSYPGDWWIQGNDHIIPVNGKWSGQVIIGNGSEKEFDVAAIIVDQNVERDFEKYVNTAEANGKWPSSKLPDSIKIKDQIEITRIS